jgi:membrane-bound metal-dependent hydrolase YbcI (DUF457 family)
MIARLLTLLFLGILLALAYEQALDLAYARLFATNPWFQSYWYMPFVLVPGLLLAALAWGVGFYRRGGHRGHDAIASLVVAAIVVLTIPASYSCGLTGCF